MEIQLQRGGVKFTFQRGNYGRIVVTATDASGRMATGELANAGGKSPAIWPRLEFRFWGGNRWIAEFCDHRFWNLDDYETGEEAERRPLDSGTFDLTADERVALQAWCDSLSADAHSPVPAPPPAVAERLSIDIDSGLGIGRIGDGDHTSEALANLEAAAITRRQAARDPYARKPVLCDCGHYDAFPMSTGRGTACADCYDRMSN